MEREKLCLLCWKPLNVGDSLIGVHDHYQQLIECCKKLLKDKHKSELDDLKLHEGEPLPFCFVCFTYSEKLYEIQKQLKHIRKCLKEWIDVFSSGISNSRMLYLPTNSTSSKFEHLNIKKENDDSPTIPTRPTSKTSDKCSSTVEREKSKGKGKSKKPKGLGQTDETVVQNQPPDTDIIICDSDIFNSTELESDGNTNVKKTSKRKKSDFTDGIVFGESTDKPPLKKRKAKIRNLEEQEKFDEESRENTNSKRRKSEGNKDIFELQEHSSRHSNFYEMDKSQPKENIVNEKQNSDKIGSEPIVELFKCSVCNLEFYLSRNLILHCKETGHVTEKSENCSQCDKKFYCKADCERHIERVHFKPQPCRVCGNNFISYEELTVHVKSHTEKSRFYSRLYKCAICDLKWMSMSALFKHMSANHDDVEPFKCYKCNRLYYTEETFNVHKSTHDGTQRDDTLTEEQYQSQHSGWTFESVEEINRKVVKPSTTLKKLTHGFTCEICDIFLDEKQYFKRHIAETGHVVKEIICIRCDKEFYRVRDLLGHNTRCKMKHWDKRAEFLKPY